MWDKNQPKVFMKGAECGGWVEEGYEEAWSRGKGVVERVKHILYIHISEKKTDLFISRREVPAQNRRKIQRKF